MLSGYIGGDVRSSAARCPRIRLPSFHCMKTASLSTSLRSTSCRATLFCLPDESSRRACRAAARPSRFAGGSSWRWGCVPGRWPKDKDGLHRTSTPAHGRGPGHAQLAHPQYVGPHRDIPIFSRDFDWAQYQRIWHTIVVLNDHAEQAWPELVRHLDDKRYSISPLAWNGYTYNLTVGGVCEELVGGTLAAAYYRHLQPENNVVYANLSWPNVSRNMHHIQPWCQQRSGKKLYELQIEACQWMIGHLREGDERACGSRRRGSRRGSPPSRPKSNRCGRRAPPSPSAASPRPWPAVRRVIFSPFTREKAEKLRTAYLAAAEKSRRVARTMVEALANRNPAPALAGTDFTVPIFVRGYDWAQDARVRQAVADVAGQAGEVWPELLGHLDDRATASRCAAPRAGAALGRWGRCAGRSWPAACRPPITITSAPSRS